MLSCCNCCNTNSETQWNHVTKHVEKIRKACHNVKLTLRSTETDRHSGVPITAGLGLCSLQHCCWPAGWEATQDRSESRHLNTRSEGCQDLPHPKLTGNPEVKLVQVKRLHNRSSNFASEHCFSKDLESTRLVILTCLFEGHLQFTVFSAKLWQWQNDFTSETEFLPWGEKEN